MQTLLPFIEPGIFLRHVQNHEMEYLVSGMCRNRLLQFNWGFRARSCKVFSDRRGL